ncbi:MAG: transposase [Saprospiraceae bacterium]|nr:transposase [Saprospiraceae bacterium]MBK8079438.1 transposase [Saprospiraceae bacterium]MBK8548947.1 transposase [Saprospiraceae bacterium]MBK8549158.1 transposase [Saprospiraceae bacterium]
MKSSKFTESQIIKALKENENGKTAEQISRELGINKATFTIGASSMEAWKCHNSKSLRSFAKRMPS